MLQLDAVYVGDDGEEAYFSIANMEGELTLTMRQWARMNHAKLLLVELKEP